MFLRLASTACEMLSCLLRPAVFVVWRLLLFTPPSAWCGDVSCGMSGTCVALNVFCVSCGAAKNASRRRLSKEEQALISLVNLLERCRLRRTLIDVNSSARCSLCSLDGARLYTNPCYTTEFNRMQLARSLASSHAVCLLSIVEPRCAHEPRTTGLTTGQYPQRAHCGQLPECASLESAFGIPRPGLCRLSVLGRQVASPCCLWAWTPGTPGHLGLLAIAGEIGASV